MADPMTRNRVRTRDQQARAALPMWLAVLVMAEVALTLSVVSLLLFVTLTLSRPTAVQIILMLLAYVGMPLVFITLAAYAARKAWHRDRRPVAVIIAIAPLLLLMAALGFAALDASNLL